MKGNNVIHLNQATMQAALNYYFEKVVFASGQAPNVKKVSLQSKNYGTDHFEVEVEEIVPPEPPGAAP